MPAAAASARPRGMPFILATIFIDAIAFGLIMPVLPQLLMDVGEIGLAQAIAFGAWIGWQWRWRVSSLPQCLAG